MVNKYRQREKNLYQPSSKEPFVVSRSKIDLFLECPRCFYLDRRLGLGRPSLPAFSLNSAVDHLLKNEFDILRQNGQRHRLMEKYGIQALPFNHPDLTVWRDDDHKFSGAQALHRKTNLLVDGIIDDLWANQQKELFVVDYKSTSTSSAISLESEYKQGYKRQMEVYQWIFRQKGFKVSETGYFVFANGLRGDRIFDGRLEFDISILPYQGSTAWVEPALLEIKKCLDSSRLPSPSPACEYCAYRRLTGQAEPRPQPSLF